MVLILSYLDSFEGFRANLSIVETNVLLNRGVVHSSKGGFHSDAIEEPVWFQENVSVNSS